MRHQYFQFDIHWIQKRGRFYIQFMNRSYLDAPNRGYYSGLNTMHKELTRVLNRRDQLLIFASTNGGRLNNGMAPCNAVCPPWKGVVQAFFEVTEPCVQVDLDGGSMIGIPEKFVLTFKHYRRKTLCQRWSFFDRYAIFQNSWFLSFLLRFFLSNVCMCACLGVSYLVGHGVVDHVLTYISGLSTVGHGLRYYSTVGSMTNTKEHCREIW